MTISGRDIEFLIPSGNGNCLTIGVDDRCKFSIICKIKEHDVLLPKDNFWERHFLTVKSVSKMFN